MGIQVRKEYRIVCDECKNLRKGEFETRFGPLDKQNLSEKRLRPILEELGWVMETREYDEPFRFICPRCVDILEIR